MYKGFNLKINGSEIENIDEKWYVEGINCLKCQKIKINENLDSYIKEDGTFTCESIQEGWFPKIDSHIFISHSHNDEKLAISLVGFLHENFGLNCFIDSIFWGYCNKLLEKIDNNFSWADKEKSLFDYDSRNLSTAHVHNILTLSLLQMIDKTECLIFINTSSSISVKDAISNKNYTFSPWISLELQIAKTIEKRRPIRFYIKENEKMQKTAQDFHFLTIKYHADTSDLIKLDIRDIEKMPDYLKNKPLDTLDYLYGIEKKEEIK